MATLANNRPRWRRRLSVAGYSFFLLLILLGTTFGGWMGSSKALKTLVMNAMGLGKSPAEVFNGHTLTILVLGCDEDLAPGGKVVLKKQARSDMMLVAKLDFDKKTISGLSIPRDMECTVDGKTHKINAFHAIGGPELAKRAVQNLTGISVDRVVVLDFDAFKDMVDMVGGVDVDVDKDLKYTDKAGGLFINIKKGHQHLDGYNSMCFVRFRHADDDWHRQARQKQFIVAFKGSVLSHFTKLPAIVDQAVKVLGGSLQGDEVGTLAAFAKSVPPANIQMGAVPAEDPDANPMEVDRKGLKKALTQFGFTEASARVAESP